MLKKIKEMKMYDKMEQDLWVEIREQMQKENNGKMTLNDMEKAREMAREEIERIKKENKKDIDVKEIAKKLVKAAKVVAMVEMGVGTTRIITSTASAVIGGTAAAKAAGSVLAATVEIEAIEQGMKFAVKQATKLVTKGAVRYATGKIVENKLED